MFESLPCTLSIAPGWHAEERDDPDTGPYVAVAPDGAGGVFFRLSGVDLVPSGLDAAAWVELAGSVHPPKGRPLQHVTCGEFTGLQTQFAVGNRRWLRGWLLRAGSLALDVTYSCPIERAGQDDAVVDAMLSTLRLKRLV